MSSATTADVYAPSDPGPWSTVVFLHGDPPSFYPLVEELARRGAVVFNARWRPSASPLTAMQDAACAVSFASGHAHDYGGSERLVVVGHSAGASVAMVAALTGNELLEADDYDGDCAFNVFFDGPRSGHRLSPEATTPPTTPETHATPSESQTPTSTSGSFQ